MDTDKKLFLIERLVSMHKEKAIESRLYNHPFLQTYNLLIQQLEGVLDGTDELLQVDVTLEELKEGYELYESSK